MTKQPRFIGMLLFFGGIGLLLSGCGSGEVRVKVTGSVLKDGKPQEGVMVSFVPADPKKADSKGARTDSAGKFLVMMKPGNYSVTLTKHVDKSGNVPKDSDDPSQDFAQLEASGKLRQVMPDKYLAPETSPIKAEIPKEGKDLTPFDVK